MTDDQKDVHTEHCCVVHGCKYGDPKCTVANRQKSQSYVCESCEWVMEDLKVERTSRYVTFEDGKVVIHAVVLTKSTLELEKLDFES